MSDTREELVEKIHEMAGVSYSVFDNHWNEIIDLVLAKGYSNGYDDGVRDGKAKAVKAFTSAKQ
jgi:hypothetical protein